MEEVRTHWIHGTIALNQYCTHGGRDGHVILGIDAQDKNIPIQKTLCMELGLGCWQCTYFQPWTLAQ